MFQNINGNRRIYLAGAIAASSLVAAFILISTSAVAQVGSYPPLTISDNPAFAFQDARHYVDYSNGVMKVKAGAGSAVAPLTQFFPQVAHIKVGETVVWYNPTRVGEPHTVTFLTNQSYFADIEAPFVVSNSSAITPLAPGANAEPVVIPAAPGKTTAILANARVDNPTIIDKDGNVTHLPPNANYTMTADERFINSGWMWPQGLSPPGLPPITSFTVKFDKPGTYNYICLIHPWMAGQVIVQ